jgi:hypothetical protein
MMLAKADSLLHDDISQGVAKRVVFAIKLERSSALGRACQLHRVSIDRETTEVQHTTRILSRSTDASISSPCSDAGSMILGTTLSAAAAVILLGFGFGFGFGFALIPCSLI